MARLKLSDSTESKWFTYVADDGEGAVRFKLRPYDRAAQEAIAKKAADKDYVKSLEIPWDEMPKVIGDTKAERLRRVIAADHIIEDWENVELDGVDGLAECNLANKVRAYNSIPLSDWMTQQAALIGAKVVEADTKN